MLNLNTHDTYFIGLLIVIILILYSNSLHGSFIWDDRAAVITNEDVHGTTPFIDIFYHDFWGKDISLKDSHKSYRPLTTITYRIDFMIYGLDSYGYHITNVLLYLFSCVSIYFVMKQWINTLGARVGILLFTIHPVHVEAVSNIVGRADVLCGLCYSISLYYYTKSIRIQYVAASYALLFESILYFVVSYLFASLAILSKEIGFTIVGIFLSIEVLEHMKVKIITSKYFKPLIQNKPKTKYIDVNSTSTTTTTTINKNINNNNINNHNNTSYTIEDDDDMLRGYFTNPSFRIGLQIFFQSIYQSFVPSYSLLRIIIILLFSIIYYIIRIKLHGSQIIYQWSIMENHIQLLPSFYQRSLNYAQYHFWYIWKLIYPMHLCFDYGYVCIPVVKDILNIWNCLPLILYGWLIYLLFYTISNLRTNLIISLAILIIPLTPALNIFIPVGTLLAERLLFIPSIGYCMILGEFISIDLLSYFDSFETFILERFINTCTYIAFFQSKTTNILYLLWNIIFNFLVNMKLIFERITSPIVALVYSSNCTGINTINAKKLTTKSILKANDPHKYDNNYNQEKISSFSQHKKEVRFDTKKNNKTYLKPNLTKSIKIITNSVTNKSINDNNSDNKEKYSNHSFNIIQFKSNIRFVLNSILCIILFTICICFGWKINHRNKDWVSEYSLFKSGLQVCPNSIKVLSNYALLSMSAGKPEIGLHYALKAIDIYPNQIAAIINTGVAYQKINNYTESIRYYRRGLQLEPKNAKIYGYLGQAYYLWSNTIIVGEYGFQAIRSEALENLLKSIDLGFYSPSILHMTGSILLDQQNIPEAIDYYLAALNQSYQIEEYYKHSIDVPKEDDINRVGTYNQLGQAYYSLKDTEKAIEMYEKGLTIQYNFMPIIANLGNIYREIGQIQKAREIMQRGIDVSGENVPPAILNNLGLLELDANNNQIALELFKKALYIHQLITSKDLQNIQDGSPISSDGVDVIVVMERNIKKAQDKLMNHH